MIRQFVTKFRRKNCDSKEIPIKKRNPSNRELKARLGKRALGAHEKRGEFAGDISICIENNSLRGIPCLGFLRNTNTSFWETKFKSTAQSSPCKRLIKMSDIDIFFVQQ